MPLALAAVPALPDGHGGRPRRLIFAPLWAAAVLLPLMSLAGGAWWSWKLVQAEALTRIERTTSTLRV